MISEGMKKHVWFVTGVLNGKRAEKREYAAPGWALKRLKSLDSGRITRHRFIWVKGELVTDKNGDNRWEWRKLLGPGKITHTKRKEGR
jgi:hypothetical protein